VRIIAVAAILLIGVSRPISECITSRMFSSAGLSADRCGSWPALRRSYRRHVEPCLSLAASCHHCAAGLALWLIAVLLNGHSTTGQPYSYLCYGGFLTGVVIARPLELSK